MHDSDKTNHKANDVYIRKLLQWLFVAAIISVIVLYFILGITSKTEVSQSRIENSLVIVKDYECVEEKDDAAPIGVRKEYILKLPDKVTTDTYLAFYTVHQYVEVFFDGQNIYSLKPSSSGKVTKTIGSNWVMIPVCVEDAGKEVRVEITPVYESFRNRQVEFIIGSGLAIYMDRLKRDLPQLILGGMAVFVGLIFVCVAGYNLIKRHRGKGIAALGLFSTMLGIWRLADTRFTPFIFPNQSALLYYISVTMLMLGMVPLMKWLEEYLTEKSRYIINIYCVVVVIICLVQLTLQFCGIFDLRETLTITHITIAVGVVLAIGIAIYEGKAYPDKSKMPLGNKLVYLCVAGVVADVVAYYMKGNSSGLIFSLMAFLLYIVFMGIATLYNYSEQEIRLAEQDRQLAQKERSLTDSRIKAMMSQIRSHFIFNVLTTISTYCKIDPQKADSALIRFSRYLRKNIKIIEEDGMIDFDAELEQVEDYVALEQLRFPQRIVFEEEIRTRSFMIPPLTIQPLVENAIKHGLMEMGRSGKITLSTMRKKDCTEITITDDGVGFEPQTLEKPESVGIRNVRYRLENMAEGSLTIDSRPGEGTIITIKIPIKESRQ